MGSLKIVHLITDLDVGGAEIVLWNLVSRMAPDRFENVVISLIEPGPIARRIRESGIRIHSLGMRPGRASLGDVWRLRAVLRRERPHVLQTWMYHSDLLGFVAGRAAGIHNVVWKITTSDYILHAPSRNTRWTFRACVLLSRFPSAVLFCSESGRAFHLSMGYRPRRYEVIPNGFDLDRFKPDPRSRESVRAELGLPAETLLGGTVARYDPQKAHDVLLEAIAAVTGADPRVHFVLAGRGVTFDNPALAGQISTLGIKGRVHLLGSREDTPRLMASLDFLVSSAIYGEGFPLAIGEAMACGVPCVVTDSGDSALMVGDSGVVVPRRNARALADGCRQMIDLGGKERAARGRRARELIEQCCKIDQIVHRYEAFYESLAAT